MKYDVTNYINDVYMRDSDKNLYCKIDSIPLLSEEEEYDLLTKMLDGDVEAKNELIIRNLKLVSTIAYKYTTGKIPFLDLFQEGVVGLINALDNFKLEMNCRLSTYAVFHIRKNIIAYFKDNCNTIRLPRYFHDKIKEYKMVEDLFIKENKEVPTEEEMSSLLNVNLETIELLKRCQTDINLARSLDDNIYKKKEQSDVKPVYEKAELTDMQIRTRKLLQCCDFTEQEKTVIKLRFGFVGEPMTLSEIGKVLNVSRERANQIERCALFKLRNNKYIKDFSVYMDDSVKANDNLERFKSQFLEKINQRKKYRLK